MINARFRFDNFVVGAGNRLAASAARAVAEAPGAAYNPLFIHAEAGLGKSHLLSAIANEAKVLNPSLVAECVAIDDFVEQLRGAIDAGQADAMKRRYAGVGLLLVDDIHGLAGRVDAQSEMLRILNSLQRGGKQIVLTADRAPSDMRDIDERLLARLAGGLLVEIAAPDYESRLNTLRQKSRERSLRFEPGVLEELARSPLASVRELEGALNRLMAHQALLASPVAVTDLWHILGSVRAPSVAKPNEFEAFLNEVATSMAASFEHWQSRLTERIAYWSGEGFHTDTLARALELGEPQDVAALDAEFAALVEQLRALEADAIRVDPTLMAHGAFRDPARLEEARALVAEAAVAAQPLPAPIPEYRLRDFSRSEENQVAISAALTVIDQPGRVASPLLLHGPVGSGKTHLAHAIGNALAGRDNATWTVACVTADGFVDELIAALQDGAVDRWRARYRAADALIVDDLHALDGKERTQEEFAALCRALQSAGKQLVLTSDRPLAQFRVLLPSLRTLLTTGVVAPLRRTAKVDRSGRTTPVAEGDEAAAPNIDVVARGEAPTTAPNAAVRPRTVTPITGSRDALDAFFLDPEKVVAEWPDTTGRLIEEFV